jgi:hypothetical protein
MWKSMYVKRMVSTHCTIYNLLSSCCVWVLYLQKSRLIMYWYCLHILNTGLHVYVVLNGWVSCDFPSMKAWKYFKSWIKNSCVSFVRKMKLCVASCIFMALFTLMDVGSSREYLYFFFIIVPYLGSKIRNALCGGHVCPSVNWWRQLNH